MKDYLIRAETREVWQTYATEQGWLVEHEGNLVPAEHVRVDELGPVVVTPGTYDEEGVEITPPVMDNWHHVNFRVIAPPPPDQPQAFAAHFAEGREVTTEEDVRAIEGDTGSGVLQVLYPEDIETPIRIWAGGMYPAELPDLTPATTKKTAKAKKK